MTNIYSDSTKQVPKSDDQIVRVTMKQNEIAGRTDHIPSGGKSSEMAISHVPNAGTKS